MQEVGRNFHTEEEYWKLEETSPVKHEFWRGKLFAMAGGTINHASAAANLIGAVGRQLAGKPCRVVGSDMRVKVEKSTNNFNTYPDAAIACPPLEFEKKRSGVKDTLLNPRVLFEVLSPSTMEYDRTGKFDEYKLIDSLTDYVVIWQDRVRIEHFHRQDGHWFIESHINRADAFELPGLEVTLSLAEIYDGIEVPDRLQLLPPLPDESDG